MTYSRIFRSALLVSAFFPAIAQALQPAPSRPESTSRRVGRSNADLNHASVGRQAVSRQAIGRLGVGHSIFGASASAAVASGIGLLGLISLVVVAATSGGPADSNNAPVSS